MLTCHRALAAFSRDRALPCEEIAGLVLASAPCDELVETPPLQDNPLLTCIAITRSFQTEGGRKQLIHSFQNVLKFFE